ncbi:PAS domain S-box protein [Muricoccus aerilatus]|uniref:PAS domain S-box protein n=1 Tax=Muricoccus aerilatus TaxID=452982 RepID=UPI000694D93D|nr:PAS domain S-box protein [Roseomonas aerilata]
MPAELRTLPFEARRARSPQGRISTPALLIVLATGLLLPVLLFSWLVLSRFAEGERSRYEGEALDYARRIAAAVDRDLGGLQGALQVLATSRLWDRSDHAELHRQALEVRALLGAEVIVKDAEGQQLVNTRFPQGNPLPRSLPPGDQAAIEGRRPIISDLFTGATAGAQIVSVNVPIVREGEVRGLINVGISPDRFAGLLRSQGLPDEWTGALVDNAGRIIARSRQHERFAGTEATRDLRERAVGAEGTWTGSTLEGTPVLSAFARSTLAGWRAAVGVPVATASASARHSLGVLLGVGALSVALAVLVAGYLGRQIARGMRQLASAAESVTLGVEPPRSASLLREVGEIEDALARAAGNLRDRTQARDLAEAELDRSRGQLQRVLDTSPVAILEVDATGAITYANRAAQSMLQLGRSEIEGRRYDAPAWDITTPEGNPISGEDLPAARALRGENVRAYVHAVRDAGTGERVVLSVNAMPLLEAGRVTGALAAFTDITDRHAAEGALREESARLETLNRTGAAIAAELDLERIVQTVTDAGVSLTGAAFGAFFYNVVNEAGENYTLYTISGVPREHFSRFPMPRNTQVFAPTFRGAPAVRSDDITADPRYGHNTPHHGMPEGHLPVRSYLAVPVVSRSGEVLGGLFFGHPEPGRFEERHEQLMTGIAAQAAVAIDNARLYGAAQREIAARRASEEALRRSEERFRAAVRAVSGVIWTNDASGEMRGEQPGWAAMTGQTPEEYEGFGWSKAVHPEDAEPTVAAWHEALLKRRTFVFEHRVRRHDGAWRLFSVRAVPILEEDGTIREWVGVHTDVTEAREAQAELRRFNERLEAEVATRTGEIAETNRRLLDEIAGRERVEAQLRQAQKMEAIGQLTGGIAHDFNNLLAVIGGSLQLLQRRLDRAEWGALQRYVDSAREGAEKAATLTHRLLAFSRRQALAPEPVDANLLVGGMSALLRRSIGEYIRIETVLAGGLWRSHADPHQLEQAILNLAVNARDAMEEGGRLTIETANTHLDEAYARDNAGVVPGQYVMVAVTDTGTGIPRQVLDKVFEPFFTTKPVGKGTGLGLSQVYGFVRQSGGHIKIYSEPGQGASVKIYLPRFLGEAAPAGEKPAPGELPSGRNERVLVVEDDPAVRRLSVEALRELGYDVVEADGPVTALRILDGDPAIVLMFTDIVMPDMNGARLAEEAQRRRPDLKVIFTTGYTRNAVVHNGVLDPGVHLVMKPFSLGDLAAKVWEVLGGETTN